MLITNLPWPTEILLAALLLALLLYLYRVDQLLRQTPEEIRRVAGPRWSPEELRATYKRLQDEPIDYTAKIPPKLDRRYIVTGGSGLVGGYIVLQLLARGNPPESIRILDIRRTERNDLGRSAAAARCDFAPTDITQPASVEAAFARPWAPSVARLPLTVFHTAAVIVASERSPRTYAFPEAVNVGGTRNVLAAARAFGADVFSSTSSGSIAIRPVRPWLRRPWARGPGAEPPGFAQVLDERDFGAPLRERGEFFGNYPASKAIAERMVCGMDRPGFRTGCIRPANGVYGNPTDNTVGDPLARSILPTWVPHIVQSFVHGANVAIAHLQHEAVLALPPPPPPIAARFSGRPYVVTDPNPPITYGDLYAAIGTLSVHPFRTVRVPPVFILLVAHAVEAYTELRFKYPLLLFGKMAPELRGDIKVVQPGIFSICTHLVANDAEARKPVAEGGLGYEGVITTLEGMVLEVLEWNEEHPDIAKVKKAYTTSISFGEKMQALGVKGEGPLTVN